MRPDGVGGRSLTVGFHATTPRGGEVAARLYSLALSCRLNGVDVQAYLEDVLGLVGTTPASQIARLTPWGWAAERRATLPG